MTHDTLSPRAPVLEALEAKEDATARAHDAGVEAATLKKLLKHLEEDTRGLERQQQATTHEPTIAALEEQLAALREARGTTTALLQEVQQRRVRLEQHAMHLREAYTALASRAKAAYQQWRKASLMVAADVSVYQRYHARVDQAHARQMLAQLVGADEVCAVLEEGGTRPWLQS